VFPGNIENNWRDHKVIGGMVFSTPLPFPCKSKNSINSTIISFRKIGQEHLKPPKAPMFHGGFSTDPWENPGKI
jgi:hypothetical protein